MSLIKRSAGNPPSKLNLHLLSEQVTGYYALQNLIKLKFRVIRHFFLKRVGWVYLILPYFVFLPIVDRLIVVDSLIKNLICGLGFLLFIYVGKNKE